MSLDLFFDYLAVRLNGDRAEGRRSVINWVFSDLGRSYVLNLENCALTYLADRRRDGADATVTLDRSTLDRLILREVPLAGALERGLVVVDGDASAVANLFGLLDDFPLSARRLPTDVRGRGAEARNYRPICTAGLVAPLGCGSLTGAPPERRGGSR
jgi:alkyl sulfatase BDS1-like metallo-beta-lactamase superfamily hydrolase